RAFDGGARATITERQAKAAPEQDSLGEVLYAEGRVDRFANRVSFWQLWVAMRTSPPRITDECKSGCFQERRFARVILPDDNVEVRRQRYPIGFTVGLVIDDPQFLDFHLKHIF